MWLTSAAPVVIMLAAAPGLPAPQSPALARQLVQALGSAKLDAIAAPDPASPGHYVAALVFPGTQLLVVSASYPVAGALDPAVAAHQYRDVYSALQQASISDGKLFIQDLGCDGLGGSDDVDVVYENGKTQTVFNGDWKGQKLSRAAYEERLSSIDVRYAHLLSTLLAAAQHAPQ